MKKIQREFLGRLWAAGKNLTKQIEINLAIEESLELHLRAEEGNLGKKNTLN